MKRFTFAFAVAMIAIAWMRSDHHGRDRPRPPQPALTTTIHVASHGRVVRIDGEDVRISYDDDQDQDQDRRPAREDADGIPVTIIPGTRVSVARFDTPEPPKPPRPPKPGRAAPKPERKPAPRPRPPVPPRPENLKAETVEVVGRLSATQERARTDAREKLVKDVATRLEGQVPRDWRIPPEMVDRLIVGTSVKEVVKDYGTLYEATLKVDFSPRSLRQIADAHHREQVKKRLAVAGVALVCVLLVLATVSGYIKADEATKGYYTNKLRAFAVAGLGIAGAVIYKMLS